MNKMSLETSIGQQIFRAIVMKNTSFFAKLALDN